MGKASRKKRQSAGAREMRERAARKQWSYVPQADEPPAVTFDRLLRTVEPDWTAQIQQASLLQRVNTTLVERGWVLVSAGTDDVEWIWPDSRRHVDVGGVEPSMIMTDMLFEHPVFTVELAKWMEEFDGGAHPRHFLDADALLAALPAIERWRDQDDGPDADPWSDLTGALVEHPDETELGEQVATPPVTRLSFPGM